MSPTLSVILPIYNVAPYLSDCLTSLASQRFSDLEVIMVNDGSTDESAEIAAAFAQRDSRFRLISQANAGLGAARNAGLPHASGKYLMFVDSDDALPGYAAEVLISALEQTGSDFATGNVQNWTPRGLTQSGIHRATHRTTLLRTHIRARRRLVMDRLAANKIFRREFWDRHSFRFPEGVRYEDIPVTIPAHALAEAVDVISLPIYYWRKREAGELSTTQRVRELKAIIDRFAAVSSAIRALEEIGPPRVKRAYVESVLRSDLMIFMRQLPEGGEEYRATFLDLATRFLADVGNQAVSALPPHIQLQWQFVQQGRLSDLLSLIVALRSEKPTVVRRAGRLYQELPGPEENNRDLVKRFVRVPKAKPRAQVRDVCWVGNSLRISGDAFFDGSSARRPWSLGRVLLLREVSTGRIVPLLARPRRAFDIAPRDDSVAHDWVGFEASLPATTLRHKGSWQNGTWRVTAAVAGWPLVGRTRVKADAMAILPAREVAAYTWIQPVQRDGAMWISVHCDSPVVADLTARPDAIDVLIDGPMLRPEARLRLCRIPGVPWKSYALDAVPNAPGLVRCTVPLSDLVSGFSATLPPLPGETGDSWIAEIESDGRVVPIFVRSSVADVTPTVGPVQVFAQRSEQNLLRFGARRVGPMVTEAFWTPEGRLHLAGVGTNGAEESTKGAEESFAILARHAGGFEDRSFPVTLTKNGWYVDIDPLATPTLAGLIHLRTGTWNLLCRTASGRSQDLAFSTSALRSTPLDTQRGRRAMRLQSIGHCQAALLVGPDLGPDERGAYHQRRLQSKAYPASRRRALRNAVVYSSFAGRQYSDNPRAIHEELVRRGVDLDHLWVVDDGQASVPPTARPVALSSRDWYEALGTCKVVITNTHLPNWFRRRDEQVVLQTGRGTPFLRVGLDSPTITGRAKRAAEVEHSASNWSLLITANRYSSTIAKRAFRYSGEIAETGYPRNDKLLTNRCEEAAALVRQQLQIEPGKRIVLYAPALRERTKDPGRWHFRVRNELADGMAKIGDDYVLLIRNHPDTLEEVFEADHPTVRDVSTYADMSDLLAAADILITDYSSTMFDFANTQRPILFLVNDEAGPQSYFDLPEHSPGPILSSPEDVVAALREIEAIEGRYAAAYEQFRAQFCEYDDGKAAVRVVDRLLTAL